MRPRSTRCSPTSPRSPTPRAAFLEDNGDNLIRLGEVSPPSSGSSRSTPRVPLPHRRHRQRRQAPGRGVPRLHPAHRAGDAAQPAPGLHPQDVPRVADDRGPNCLKLPNPPWSQANPVPHQPNLNDGVDEPTGKGTSRSRHRGYDRAGRPARQRPGVRDAAEVPARSRPRPHRRRRPDLGALLLVGPMARGAEVSAMSLLGQEDRASTSSSCSSSSSSRRWRPASSWSRSATSRSAQKNYKAEFVDATGVVKGDDIRIAGVKVGSVKDVEIVDRTRALVTFSGPGRDPGHGGDPRRRSATATWSASATSR